MRLIGILHKKEANNLEVLQVIEKKIK
jgi:hypothetical protein